MRLRRNEKVELIRRVPLFAKCSGRELAEVAQVADEIDLREGKEMTREGAPGREFFVLLEGTADVRKGKRKINSLGPGDFFGEIALLTDRGRTATVTATSPVTLVVMAGRDLQMLERHAPEVSDRLKRVLGERLERSATL